MNKLFLFSVLTCCFAGFSANAAPWAEAASSKTSVYLVDIASISPHASTITDVTILAIDRRTRQISSSSFAIDCLGENYRETSFALLNENGQIGEIARLDTPSVPIGQFVQMRQLKAFICNRRTYTAAANRSSLQNLNSAINYLRVQPATID